MRIRDEHLYHGAALNQIAEHKKFTAINTLKVKGKVSRSAFRINAQTDVYLKYARKTAGKFKEYQFIFTKDHRAELKNIVDAGGDLYIVLVCVRDKHICCITYQEFEKLLEARRKSAGRVEAQFVILVTLSPGEAFRAYVNSPGKRGKFLKPKLKIPRNRFPENVVK
jgi:hypothetical protein